MRDTSGPLNHYGSAILKTEKRGVKMKSIKSLWALPCRRRNQERKRRKHHARLYGLALMNDGHVISISKKEISRLVFGLNLLLLKIKY